MNKFLVLFFVSVAIVLLFKLFLWSPSYENEKNTYRFIEKKINNINIQSSNMETVLKT